MSTPTIPQLKHAIALSEQIENLQAELASLFGGSVKVPVPVMAAPVAKAKKRTMSPAAREKIAAAQRARWAKSKGLESATLAGPVEAAPVVKTKKKRKISAAHRAKLKAAAKARWAKLNAK